jgi:protein-disulfide isomerase
MNCSACYNFFMDPKPQSSPSDDSIPAATPETPLTPGSRPAATAVPQRYRTRPWHVHAAFLPLVFLLGLGVGYLVWDRSAKTTPAAADPSTTGGSAAAEQTAKRYDVPVSDTDPIYGAADAPVTLIMFSDYQCTYCRKWYGETFKALMAAYPGKLRFVYKDFPLSSIHPEASPAALAARCAGEQGKYWDYQDLLFTSSTGLSAVAYRQYASDLSLDSARFDDCLSTKRYEQAIEADYQTAATLGIQSTPTFFINGVPILGAEPIDSFKQIIDQELAGNIN